jgi:hypothetical protein
MAKFLHIAFSFKSGQTNVSRIRTAIGSARDWYRYAPNCWIVYTTRTPEKWFEILKPKLSDDDHMFICELDVANRQGWLPEGAWSWLDKERAS